MGEILSTMNETLMGYSIFDVFKLVLLIVICLIVRKAILVIFSRMTEKANMEKTLQKFSKAMLGVLLWVVIIMIVAEHMGISMTSLLAVLSVAGLAVSLAVQGVLSNLAGGFTVLSTKPFVVGDYVEAGGVSGTVKEVGLVHTKLSTVDNKVISVPNSQISSEKIINYSAMPTRRVDLVFSASYDAPIEKVEQVLMDVVTNHEKVLNEPAAPFVRVSKYGSSAIDYTVRVWCASADYWTVYFDVLKAVDGAFKANNIEMTYDHLNVHICKE
jgi:small conductance mechanosensitive channel